MTHAGELAALVTAFCWACTAIAFASAGRRIGSMAVNILRLAMAFVLLSARGLVVRGLPFPTDADRRAWIWLALSGIAGFTFGDLCLFRAFVVLGPRLSTLLMSLSPPFAAAIAWWCEGERLSTLDLAGMTITLAGVSWAVLAREGATGHATFTGILLGIGGALGQAAGLVLSKHGMGSYDAFAATQIRVLSGMAGFALVFTLVGWWPQVRASVRDRTALGHTAVGAFFGPFLGVSMSLYAVQHTATGVAASIMASTPVMILPFLAITRSERIGPSAIGAALVAVAGVTLLFAPA
ncbi:MAG: DMT family transporter [Acidobacteriota bacterium]